MNMYIQFNGADWANDSTFIMRTFICISGQSKLNSRPNTEKCHAWVNILFRKLEVEKIPYDDNNCLALVVISFVFVEWVGSSPNSSVYFSKWVIEFTYGEFKFTSTVYIALLNNFLSYYLTIRPCSTNAAIRISSSFRIRLLKLIIRVYMHNGFSALYVNWWTFLQEQ